MSHAIAPSGVEGHRRLVERTCRGTDGHLASPNVEVGSGGRRHRAPDHSTVPRLRTEVRPVMP
ncbi:hypothetical protein [Nocardiopsis sp. CNR-923]|uniref:hypothetical protein n=1 Tax=Nocardiopsis sp. CNR-923 TaxID=1904965 RepID=UPI001180232C|nr:hypothetical protein [Nocardiopsis sp. CNR-923]